MTITRSNVGPSPETLRLPSYLQDFARQAADNEQVIYVQESQGCDGLANISTLGATDCDQTPAGPILLANLRNGIVAPILGTTPRPFAGTAGHLPVVVALSGADVAPCSPTVAEREAARRYQDNSGNLWRADGTWLSAGHGDPGRTMEYRYYSASNEFGIRADLVREHPDGYSTVLGVPSTPSLALAGVAGSVPVGVRTYFVVNFDSTNTPSIQSDSVTIVVSSSSNAQVDITVPLGPAGTTYRQIFRFKRTSIGPDLPYFLTQIDDNSTTTYRDNSAAGALTVPLFVDRRIDTAGEDLDGKRCATGTLTADDETWTTNGSAGYGYPGRDQALRGICSSDICGRIKSTDYVFGIEWADETKAGPVLVVRLYSDLSLLAKLVIGTSVHSPTVDYTIDVADDGTFIVHKIPAVSSGAATVDVLRFAYIGGVIAYLGTVRLTNDNTGGKAAATTGLYVKQVA